MEKHFVKFFCPGAIVAEEEILPIDDWDVDKAKEMSKDILQRWNSKPYAFQFITKSRTDDELDSHVSAKSGVYYINGKVQTLEELRAENNPKNAILISNMENNGWDKVVTTFSPWRFTQPFYEDKDSVVFI